jgi:DNA-binding MurR/RpiR family transcriptional regulator
MPAAISSRMPRVAGRPLDLSQHLQNEVQNLVRTIEQQRPDELNRAVRLMARAEKLWVVGFGDNYPLAHFARAHLIKVRSDVRMLPIGGFSMPEEFASLNDQDAMLCLGVGRRTRSLLNIMSGARHVGAPIIYLTDSSGSDDAGAGGVTLRCRITGPSLFDSPSAAVALLNYLCSSLANYLGETTISRLRLIDDIHHSWGDLDDAPTV